MVLSWTRPSVTPLCITCFLLFLINPLFLNLFFSLLPCSRLSVCVCTLHLFSSQILSLLPESCSWSDFSLFHYVVFFSRETGPWWRGQETSGEFIWKHWQVTFQLWTLHWIDWSCHFLFSFSEVSHFRIFTNNIRVQKVGRLNILDQTPSFSKKITIIIYMREICNWLLKVTTQLQ